MKRVLKKHFRKILKVKIVENKVCKYKSNNKNKRLEKGMERYRGPEIAFIESRV